MPGAKPAVFVVMIRSLNSALYKQAGRGGAATCLFPPATYPLFRLWGRGYSVVVYIDARRVECHPCPARRGPDLRGGHVGYAACARQRARGITGRFSTDHLAYRVIRNFRRDLPNCRVIEYHGVSIVGGFIGHLCYLYLLLRHKR